MTVRRALALAFVVASVVASVLACSKPDQASSGGGGGGGAGGPVTTCTKAEQQCVYSEGKLGLCTPSAMECDGAGQCLVCMSLH